MKWEYKVVTERECDYRYSSNIAIEKFLNNMDSKGWRLFSYSAGEPCTWMFRRQRMSLFNWFSPRKRHCKMYTIVFRFGAVKEFSGAAKKTPQFERWPQFERNLLVIQEIEVGQYQRITVPKDGIKDRHGRVVALDGTPKWLTDNSDILSLEPDADGYGVKVTPLVAGKATLTFQGDGDLGPDVSLVIGTIDYTVKQAPAATVELKPEPPVDIPPAA